MMGQPGIRAVDGADRSFVLSFSSEEPVKRYFGAEILDHSPGAADFSRLNDIGCLLFNHDRNTVLGRVLRTWLENGRGCAEVKFDTDPEAETIFQKVRSGTLRGVSVGYQVESWEEVAPNKTSADGRFIGPADIARIWSAYEISIVSVPADASVGVGRQYENYEEERFMDEENNKTVVTEIGDEPQTDIKPPDGTRTSDKSRTEADVKQSLEPQADNRAAEPDISERAVIAERARASQISALCREFDIEPDEFIKRGDSIADAQRHVLEQLRATRGPVTAAVQADEADKFRAAATDGLILRGGLELEKAAPGANDFRGMSLRDLAVECLTMEGVANARRMDNDTLLRQFFNPTSAFPSILDATLQKSYAQGYETVSVTFDKWTTKGTLPDFKESRGNYYLAGPAGKFLLVPEGGELKADKPEDTTMPKRKLQTYGRQFTMSREAFINDDIGFLTTLPSRYAASAKRTINGQVYDMLLNNAVIYDNKPLFGKNRGNLVADGTGITSKVIQKMINMLRLQKDKLDQPIIIEPKFLIVPIGLGFALRTILGSPTINTPDNTQAVNPIYNYPFTVIEEPALNAVPEGQPLPWFIAANPTEVRTIQVDYLNGHEIPTIRRMEHAGQLGFVWDIYLDWGVSALDFRGLVKNPGIPFAEED